MEETLNRTVDESVFKMVHKPNGFNINQFKNDYKKEIYESSQMQKSARTELSKRSKSIVTPLCK